MTIMAGSAAIMPPEAPMHRNASEWPHASATTDLVVTSALGRWAERRLTLPVLRWVRHFVVLRAPDGREAWFQRANGEGCRAGRGGAGGGHREHAASDWRGWRVAAWFLIPGFCPDESMWESRGGPPRLRTCRRCSAEFEVAPRDLSQMCPACKAAAGLGFAAVGGADGAMGAEQARKEGGGWTA